MMLLDQYNIAIANQQITDDPVQREIISHLQRVADEIAITPRHKWFTLGRKKPVSGIYLYGPVGVGKTYLIDLFYNYVAEKKKARFHFHEFMQQVDDQLRRLQGQKDPLLRIAANLAKKIRLLCFDEFLVTDVAVAMILAELLQALYTHDIILIATSNTRPDDLYLNGVQRDRFLPAIELIKDHSQILVLDDRCDYRLGRTPLHQAYLWPLDQSAADSMIKQFSAISDSIEDNIEITVQNRQIPCLKYCHHAVWFQFDTLCNLPRSQLDYLEIASRFDTVFVSDIPQLSANDTVKTILLIQFIDVMYDRGIKLVLSAAVPIEQLYTEGEMNSSFKRTLSRLEEMQSMDYLQRHQRRKIQTF